MAKNQKPQITYKSSGLGHSVMLNEACVNALLLGADRNATNPDAIRYDKFSNAVLRINRLDAPKIKTLFDELSALGLERLVSIRKEIRESGASHQTSTSHTSSGIYTPNPDGANPSDWVSEDGELDPLHFACENGIAAGSVPTLESLLEQASTR